MFGQPTHAWLTRYCLNKGLVQCEVVQVTVGRLETWVHVMYRGRCMAFRLDKDCFWSQEQALIRAERIRRNRIATLLRQLKTLRSQQFHE